MILRNFLYLDTATVDDYISTLDGSILEGPIDQTELEKSEKGGKAGYKLIEGNIAAESSKQTKQKRTVTDAAKFQGLIETLAEQKGYRFIDAFDHDFWSEIRRGELLEIQANIRIPEWFNIIQTIDDLSPLLDLMIAIGEDQIIDDKTRTAIQGISGFGRLLENRAIPIIFQTVSTPGYEFVANLSRQYLRVNLTNFLGEALIFGKVQRVLQKGEKYEAFSILPAFSSLMPNLNNAQKNKIQRDMAKRKLSEIIRGPALIIAPVAVYR